MFGGAAPGFDPEAFWDGCFSASRAVEMVEKYAALAELARSPEAARRPLLRRLASEWPASLREGELIGPARVDERLEWARRGARASLGAREFATHEAATSVLLWSHLHPLVRDVVGFRRARRRDPNGEYQQFREWIADDPARIERWPGPERLETACGVAGLRVRSAYLWLAACSGIELAPLHHLLFARAGHWDRRVGDPQWSHATEAG